MEYSKVLDLDSITLADCVELFEKGVATIINDGRVVELKEVA